MIRWALVILWGLLLASVLRALLARRAPQNRRRRAPDELVKDPVCQAYIVRSRALTRTDHGVVHYFCSPECARQFAHGVSGSRG